MPLRDIESGGCMALCAGITFRGVLHQLHAAR
jgi:hypothetical protein